MGESRNHTSNAQQPPPSPKWIDGLRRSGALRRASFLYAAGGALVAALSLLTAQCGGDQKAGPACDPKTFTKPKCDGKKIVACGPDGHEVSKDCAADGMSCLKNAKGEPTCGKICPPYVDSLGACDDKRIQSCDGDVLVETDCTKQNVNYTCGYLLEGYPMCTKNYCMEAQDTGEYHGDAGVNAEGSCASDMDGHDPADTGKVIYHRCSGTVFQESLDCSLAGAKYTCARDGQSVAQCTEPNPGVDAFGKCGKDDKGKPAAEHLDGKQYFKLTCEGDTQCAIVDRFGVGCRGCGDALPEGSCSHSKTGRVTLCNESGERVFESCIARGGECGFSDDECRYQCIGTKDGRTCKDDALSPTQAKCKGEPVTGLPQIVLCTPEGERVVVECPAASDGSVQCKEFMAGDVVPVADGGAEEPDAGLMLPDGGGFAPTGGVVKDGDPLTPAGPANDMLRIGCVTTTPCGMNGARCTDRGVLLKCDGALIPSWIDCRAAGAECVDDGIDAHCACSGDLPAWASRCIYGQQLKCMGERVERVPCKCEPPP